MSFDRVLTTILFTDIVGSTTKLAAIPAMRSSKMLPLGCRDLSEEVEPFEREDHPDLVVGPAGATIRVGDAGFTRSRG